MRASPTNRVPAPRQLRLRDLVAVGAGGLASRRLRATLSALGVAIGIAAIVAVLGISESSKADLLAQLDRLGTNLLTVAPGQTFAGEDATLPEESVGMIRRIAPVQQTAAIATVSDTAVYRSDQIPPEETGGSPWPRPTCGCWRLGIANVMVIGVLERRSEIGLRRALGATRGHVRTQFLVESLLLALLGGAGGVALGAVVTAGYALHQHWQVVVPLTAAAGGVGAALALGAVAGLYPAVRAARLSPTEALRTV